MFAIHVKPGPVSFSARLQTTFALLIPRLWWSAPPDRLLRLPLRVIMIRVPLRCHSSSPPHSFQSGFGVSFALNSALWLSTVSVEHSLQLWCASAVSTLRFADSDVTPRCCFFSCNDKAMCGSREMPLKDMTGERYDIPVLGSDVFPVSTCGTHTKNRLPPLIPFWYVHKMRLKVSQSSGTRIPNKIVCLCRLPVKTD